MSLSDHQGSVRDVIDNSGTVLNHITYDSFGQVTSETDPTFDFRFGYTGRERDKESDLMYYRARYFDPATGTFVGEDPLGFAAGDANLYRYVFNSPTNFTDPDGQVALTLVGAGAALVVAAGLYAYRDLNRDHNATPQAMQRGVSDGLQQIGDTLSNLNQSLEQQTRNASQNIRDNARRYRNLADGAVDALPTTVATPGAFERPAQDFPIPQSPPANFTPEKPTNGVGNPNAINEPISRSIPIDLLCPPWLNDDGKLDLPSWLESGPIPAPESLPAFPEASCAKPKTPVQGGGGLRKRWKDRKGNIYEWDSLHGTVEKYNKTGKHQGEFDPVTGEQLKPANKNYKVKP